MNIARVLLLILGLTVGSSWAAAQTDGTAATGSPAAPATTDYSRVHWQNLREAQARSQAEQKPLLIHFTAPWCGWCKKMERETYSVPAVIHYLNDNFTMAKVDTDKLPAMATKYQVEGLPTLWFQEDGGKRLTRLDGFTSADNLMPLLEFIVARDYEWTDYKTWLERRK